MKRNSSTTDRKAFTHIEMVVVISVLAAVGIVLVPVIADELLATQSSNALGDCQRIATGINQFIKDTEQRPTVAADGQSIEFLYGSGTLPESHPFEGRSGPIANFLNKPARDVAHAGLHWKGPYLPEIPRDPWGNAYLVNVGAYDNRDEYVWVLSAGPNGIVDTGPESDRIMGDDVGVVID